MSNFELATQPSTSQEERQRLLSIVIVGGGPTGVEFGAEMYDFVQQVKHFSSCILNKHRLIFLILKLLLLFETT